MSFRDSVNNHRIYYAKEIVPETYEAEKLAWEEGRSDNTPGRRRYWCAGCGQETYDWSDYEKSSCLDLGAGYYEELAEQRQLVAEVLPPMTDEEWHARRRAKP